MIQLKINGCHTVSLQSWNRIFSGYNLKFQRKSLKLHYFSQIDSYSTAHSADAAYVIGGYQGGYHTTGIFEFKNDQTERQYHGSISIEHQTMVLGGWNDSKL